MSHGGTTPQRSRRTSRWLAALLVPLTAGCSALPWGGSAPSGPEGVGERDDPVGVGVTTSVGDYETSVEAIDLDAADEILSHRPTNDPPGDGQAFVMATLDLVFWSSGRGYPGEDLLIQAVAPDGAPYDSTGRPCGFIPDDLLVQGPVTTRGHLIGNVCWSVPDEHVGSLLMAVTPAGASEAHYFSLRQDA